MNRQQRRAMGAPIQENQRVQVAIEGKNLVRLQMIGMTSHVVTHVLLEPKTALKLGWSLIKSAYKAWRRDL